MERPSSSSVDFGHTWEESPGQITCSLLHAAESSKPRRKSIMAPLFEKEISNFLESVKE